MSFNNRLALISITRENSNARVFTIVLIGLIVVLFLLWTEVRSNQEQIQAAYNADSQRQKLVQLASTIDLNHHRFLRSLTQFVNGSGLVTRDAARWRLQHYAARFDELRPHLAEIEISTAKHQYQSGLSDMALTRNQRVAHTIRQLLHDGKATIVDVAMQIDALEPGDFALYDEIVNVMDSLGDDITALELAAQSRQQLLDEKALENKALLAGKLTAAKASMGIGLLVLFTLGFYYIRHRHIAARNLRQSNEKLHRQIEESRKLTEELQYRATHDPLSGLYNRSGFTALIQEILHGETGDHGLCFIDLDMFKMVNDTSGHAAGDQLIVEVAELISAKSPHGSVVARFGGDEFLVLVRNCYRAEFEAAMQHCCDSLRTLCFNFRGRRFSISGSFGAIHFDATQHDLDTLMNFVDSACYEAKSEGGGRIVFSSGMVSDVDLKRDDHEWVNKIQFALENDAFCLYYQPIARINKANGKPVHSWELLLRMIDEDGVVTAPGKFLDVAEQYALAPRIDSWVINRTFAWLSRIGGRVDEVDCININLSGKSIGNSDLLELIIHHAAEFEGDLSKICFEITETAIVGDNAREFLCSLKALGFQIALDDFGSGFSSFGYLESLPVDYIKIDGIFVRDIDTNPTHHEFVKAINAVGKAMEKMTVAEFVENGESLSILKELGVDFAQGYHLARPLPLPENYRQIYDEKQGLRKAA